LVLRAAHAQDDNHERTTGMAGDYSSAPKNAAARFFWAAGRTNASVPTWFVLLQGLQGCLDCWDRLLVSAEVFGIVF
jgi:hypothetical protein